MAIDQGDSRHVETTRLQACNSDSRFIDRHSANYDSVQMYRVFQGALLFLLLAKTPVNYGTVGFDASKIDVRRGRNVEAEERREFEEGFVQDLGCTVDEPWLRSVEARHMP